MTSKRIYAAPLITLFILQMGCVELQKKLNEFQVALGSAVKAESLKSRADGYQAGYELKEIIGSVELAQFEVIDSYIQGLDSKAEAIKLDIEGEQVVYEKSQALNYNVGEAFGIKELAEFEQSAQEAAPDTHTRRIMSLQEQLNRAQVLKQKTQAEVQALR